jgi:hypothetical protein
VWRELKAKYYIEPCATTLHPRKLRKIFHFITEIILRYADDVWPLRRNVLSSPQRPDKPKGPTEPSIE